MRTIPEELVSPSAELVQVATGATWSEGPCWIPDLGVLRWSDIHGDRILQYTPGTGETSEHRVGVEFTNGRTYHPQGYVVQCSHGRRRIETDRDGETQGLVSEWSGGRFNSPNDVIVARDGSIWFTDPHYGLTSPGEGHPGVMEYGACYVFRYDPASGEALPVITDMEEPNGLAFSPDDSVLYVADSSAVRRPAGVGNRHVRAYRVDWEEGHVQCTDGVTVFEIPEGIPDGLRVDQAGRIWCSGEDGVHIYSPAGAHLGHLPVPERVGNLCFGGDDGRDLYIAATTSIYRIRTHVRDATYVGNCPAES